jgi:hypothetical protein
VRIPALAASNVINFRYHLVSLMAVFIALSVGIAVGVSLSPSVDQGLLQQAAQDRKQVTDLRTELDRRDALDSYREAYEQRIGKSVATGVLDGTRVVMVEMPDAPTGVVQAITTAVQGAGGTVVHDVRVSADAFDTKNAQKIDDALAPWQVPLGLSTSMSQATKVGLGLARSVADRAVNDRDPAAVQIGTALSDKGLVTISKGTTAQAQLVIVVTAQAADPRPAAELVTAHVQFDVGLKGSSAAVVLAGPNSDEIEGTDVLQARTDASSVDVLSTVDVADLASGVTTTVLAGKEQLLGKVGKHYGALAKADAPAPDLPVR